MIEFNATFLVAMISFVVFMFIMNAIFYQPILNIIKKREQYVSSNYQEAKNINLQAEECKNEHDTKLINAKEQSRHQISISVDIAKKEAFDKTQEAKENAKNEILSKKEELLHQKENFHSDYSELSDLIVEKISKGAI